jgi:transposase
MANVLSNEKRHQVLVLGRLGWPLRRIEEETGVRRETASAYLKAAGVSVRKPGKWGHGPPKPAKDPSTDPEAKPAKEVSTDSGSQPWPAEPGRCPASSACEPFREFILGEIAKGRNAMAIWQDLVDDFGFKARYASVKRFVRSVRGKVAPEACGVIVTPPGEEAQVDYGEGPMVRHPETGKYRRTRLFVMTLGYSRKSVRLLTFKSSTRIWASLHEQAFRRLGGAPKLVVLDNLREGILKPDIYDPAVNPLYCALLRHYGAAALACRVRDPDRKGKVESGVGHAQGTPLKGLRFEALEAAQAYLDRWEERWADTRIHGTTKRQVAAMFAEEQPSLNPLPLEPFRYFDFGARTVHLDGHVEVEGAYYSVPPGYIGEELPVQWDERQVRILDASTGQLLREHLRQCPGRHRTAEADRPKRTPTTTTHLLLKAGMAGRSIGRLCQNDPPQRRRGGSPAHPGRPRPRSQTRRRSRRGRLRRRPRDGRPDLPLRAPLPRTPSPAADVAAPSGPAHPPTHRIPRCRQPPHYERRTNVNLIEVTRAMRQLRISGMAATIENRLLQAQAKKWAPVDLISALLQDELVRRQDRLLERWRKRAEFRDHGKTLDNFDFTFNPKMDRRLIFELATGRFVNGREDVLFLGPPGTGKSHLAQAIGDAVIRQGHKSSTARRTCFWQSSRKPGSRAGARSAHRGIVYRAAAYRRRPRHAKAARDRGRRPPRGGDASV